MSHTLRIGLALHSNTPYWVQVREALYERAVQLSFELVAISLAESLETLSEEETVSLLEELLALEMEALIAWTLPNDLTCRVLQFGVPIILLSETTIRHPLLVSPPNLQYVTTKVGGHFLIESLGDSGGFVLLLGDLSQTGRFNCTEHPTISINDIFRNCDHLLLKHIPIPIINDCEQACLQLHKTLPQITHPIDAIFGLSDTLALAGRDVSKMLGLAHQHTQVIGMGGTPEALIEIASGNMTATVEIQADALGHHVIDLAHQAARGLPLPTNLEYSTHLITAENVANVSAQKLAATTSFYSRMMDLRRQQQQQQLTQLRTSLEISRRVGSILDHRELSHEIANLIRANYGYDRVQIFRWSEEEQTLTLEQSNQSQADQVNIPLAESDILSYALMHNEAVLIPDTQRSSRFSTDPHWPDTRARVVLPIRMSNRLLGLLDLHSHWASPRTRQELVGLQSLADQLGVAMENADLYEEALQAQEAAEKADRLKTRLLANVSHELRTPLNTILGFVRPALDSPNPYNVELPSALRGDLEHIFYSAEHLLRVINDLLDLSRAEIDELDLHIEVIDPRPFLEEVFHSIENTAAPKSEIAWRLLLPEHLPLLQVDPVRLRQILLNLLSNARKFTEKGQISLGAEVTLPYLHIWVQDTGVGIRVDRQERIFEPFVTAEYAQRRSEGIGLGLSITRQLVALHRGSITLESRPGQGSTFHIYLPLPSLGEQPAAPFSISAQPVLLLISAQSQPAAEIVDFSQRQGLEIRQLLAGEDPDTVLKETLPEALAWDLANAEPSDWMTLHRLRQHPQLCQVPFILYGQSSGDKPELAFGMTSLITKPVNRGTLLESIKALCPPRSVSPILIVDDDPQARKLYQGIVEKGMPGYPLRLAENGATALAVLSKQTPCLVMLDLMMPEVDGFEVLDYMRANQETRRVPVLILSGRMLTVDDIKRLEKHAMVTFQGKGILSEEETTATLYRLLAGEDLLSPQTSALVKRSVVYLQQNYNHSLARREIADAIGVSENHLSRIFRRELGISPWDYLNRYRIKKAQELLTHTNDSITSVAFQVGFNDSAYFSRVFRKQVGVSPSIFRERTD